MTESKFKKMCVDLYFKYTDLRFYIITKPKEFWLVVISIILCIISWYVFINKFIIDVKNKN